MMTAIFQGLPQNSEGELKVDFLALPVLPGGEVYFRGMALNGTDGRPLFVQDDGLYPLLFLNGIAFHSPTGICVASVSPGPYTNAPGGLLADNRGCVVAGTNGGTDLFHQGVGIYEINGVLAVDINP